MKRDDRRRLKAIGFMVRAIFVACLMLTFSALGHVCSSLSSAEKIVEIQPVSSAVLSLVSVLFSIVLGLLVSASYAQFNTLKNDLQMIVSSLAQVNYILRHMNPPPNEALHGAILFVEEIRCRFWGDRSVSDLKKLSYDKIFGEFNGIIQFLDAIDFTGGHQGDLFELRNLIGDTIKIQLTVIRAVRSRIPNLLLSVVFGWACLIFFIFGILIREDILSFGILFVGAVSIAAAYYLILELTNPFWGFFSVSSEMFDLLIRHLRSEVPHGRVKTRNQVGTSESSALK